MKSLLLAVAVIANQQGYYTSLANHLGRWLRSESVPEHCFFCQQYR